MQNESDRFGARRLLGHLLLTAVVWSAPYALAASTDAPTATDTPGAATDESAASTTAETTKRDSAAGSTAAPAAKPAKKPDDESSKEPGEFKPSESLSEDATVAYPSDI
jgi:hypothetical protein